MITIEGNSITEVVYKGLEAFKEDSKEIEVGFDVKSFKELSPVLINIKQPLNRTLVIPERNNNIIATLAECLWVLGGRNDVAFLEKYMHNASNFCQDGMIWKSGYGERIFHHFDINQFKEAYLELKRHDISNRANMVLFDPKVDLIGRKRENPCTIWVHFAVRENKLNTYVSMRANDIIWGFSHINVFEWSVLSELLAYWLNIDVGEYYHFCASWRIYERHYEKCNDILEKKLDEENYVENKSLRQEKIDIPYDEFDCMMKEFFAIESEFDMCDSTNVDQVLKRIFNIKSKFLTNSLLILLAYRLFEKKEYKLFERVFELLRDDVMKLACAEYYIRHVDKKNDLLTFFKSKFDLWEIQ